MMLQQILLFLRGQFELINIGLILVALYLLHLEFPPAQGMVVVLCCALSFFYLASGVLVLTDKGNIEKVMRIIWFIGMWAIAIAVLGMMARLLFWESNEILLMVAGAGVLASFAFIVLNRMGLDERVKDAYVMEMRPLMRRLIPAAAIGAMLFFSNYPTLYRVFGEYRHDSDYIELLSNKLNHPSNMNFRDDWEVYHDSLRIEKRARFERFKNQQSE